MIKIVGKPLIVSREEFRAIVQATACILDYHGRKVDHAVIYLEDKPVSDGKRVCGCCDFNGKIRINREMNYEYMLTTVVHEMIHVSKIHADRDWWLPGVEKVTSTLTSKLKPDVARLANILVENTYKRAAYLAHAKITYKPKGRDRYDKSEDKVNHEDSRGQKYRAKARKP